MQAISCRFLTIPDHSPPPIQLSSRLPAASTSNTVLSTSASVATPSSVVLQPVTTADYDVRDSLSTAFWDYQSLFVSQRSESSEPILLRLVHGGVPYDFPAGTYYLAGPGLFTDDHGSTVHPLDGHGYLRAFSFGGGAVKYSARYVSTKAQKEERDEVTGSWRFTHRGPFSVLRGGKRVGNVKVMKNVANTSVVRWGGRLLCLWEGGDPYEIDPETLDTVGPFDMYDRAVGGWSGEGESGGGGGGIGKLGVNVAAMLLKPILYGVFKMPAKRLLSHYKIDSQRNRLIVLSCNAEDMLLPLSNFTFYEFDMDFKLVHKKDFSIPDHLMIHDWAFTDGHYIITGNRIKLDVPGSLLAASGLSPMISALAVNPSRSTTPIYLLPRFSSGGGRDWRRPVEAPSQLWVLHVGNAFEQRDGDGNVEIELQASACSYHWFSFQKLFGYDWESGRLDPSIMNPVEEGKESLLPHLIKVSIALDVEGRHQECSVTNASSDWKRPADFPAINPVFSGRKNTYTYTGTTSGTRRFLPHFPFDSVAKLNCTDGSVATWFAGARRFVGEPVFVPRGEEEGKEEDGYILVVEYAVSEKMCNLVILDARHIGSSDAVVAKFEIPKHLNFPLGFHGFWAGK